MSNILLLELADINAPPLIRYTIKLIDNKILTTKRGRREKNRGTRSNMIRPNSCILVYDKTGI